MARCNLEKWALLIAFGAILALFLLGFARIAGPTNKNPSPRPAPHHHISGQRALVRL